MELKAKLQISFPEALQRFSGFNQCNPSYSDAARRGAAQHLSAAARVTRSVTAVTPSAPPAGAASAAPPAAKKGQQTSGPAGPRASARADRPEKLPSVLVERASSTTSEEAMEATNTPPVSQTPKERRSSIELAAKKEKSRIRGPGKTS